MAYEDFNLEHTRQLMKEKEQLIEENKRLMQQLNSKDKIIHEKDNLIYKQNIRLRNVDETALKIQQARGKRSWIT